MKKFTKLELDKIDEIIDINKKYKQEEEEERKILDGYNELLNKRDEIYN